MGLTENRTHDLKRWQALMLISNIDLTTAPLWQLQKSNADDMSHHHISYTILTLRNSHLLSRILGYNSQIKTTIYNKIRFIWLSYEYTGALVWKWEERSKIEFQMFDRNLIVWCDSYINPEETREAWNTFSEEKWFRILYLALRHYGNSSRTEVFWEKSRKCVVPLKLVESKN
jgi:hypothetical protein